MSERTITVRVGDLEVAGAGTTLVTIGLGSCVAIALYDPERRIGGLAHTLLPTPADSRSATPPGRFASTASALLLDRMIAEGAERERIHARLVGGAAMFEALQINGQSSLGIRNVETARAALRESGIPIRGEDVGGAHGRSVYFSIDDGRVLVTSVLQPDVVL